MFFKILFVMAATMVAMAKPVSPAPTGQECKDCKGTGLVDGKMCQTCQGKGSVY